MCRVDRVPLASRRTRCTRVWPGGLTRLEAIRESLLAFKGAEKLSRHSGSGRPRLARSDESDPQPNGPEIVVRRDGIEPPTRGFSVPCSTD